MSRSPLLKELEPLNLADAPDVLKVEHVQRITTWNRNYIGLLVREGYLANIGGENREYRVPKMSLADLLERVCRGGIVLPPRPRAKKRGAE